MVLLNIGRKYYKQLRGDSFSRRYCYNVTKMRRVFNSLRILRMTQAAASVLILLLVTIFVLPSYSGAVDPSSLSVVQTNDSAEAGVSGFNINYVEDHGDDYDPNMEEFVATNEWQQIKHGQAIPRGLHVRMNLQTGVKEAKLLDPEDRTGEESSQLAADTDTKGETSEDMARMLRMKENLEKAMKDLEDQQKTGENLAYWKEGAKEGMMNMGKDTFTKEELKEALKKFKANRDDVQNQDMVKNEYKSMDELKEDMDALNLGMKTDVEIIRELVDLYKNETTSEEEKVFILSDLEYYVHQIDNALDLVDMGGMDLVLKALNSTNEEIRSEAAFVIGSAAQSNPKVQVYMLDNGIMSTLIRILSTKTSQTLRNRILYAMSSLLRHFPYAQQHFLQHGGLQALSTVFQAGGTEKLQLKAVTLINDLVTEKNLAVIHLREEDSQQKEKLKQYKRVLLLEALKEHGWCESVSSLLGTSEHDSREKVINAMSTLAGECKETFVPSVEKLVKLQREYHKLSQEEISENDDDLYFTGIFRTLENLIQKIQAVKDEL